MSAKYSLCHKKTMCAIVSWNHDVILKTTSTVELVDDTYTTINASWLFITSRSALTL